jgi:DNA-binding transcriptional regulator YdaS (Cro superfamily)
MINRRGVVRHGVGRGKTDYRALLVAIEKAGGYSALARQLGIAYQSIQGWEKIPAERVVQIEAVTGIPRQELRPDLYEGMRESA